MSFIALKREILELSVKERFRLAGFLADLEKEKETSFRRTVGRRMARMDAGKKVTMAQFEERHRLLKAKGN